MISIIVDAAFWGLGLGAAITDWVVFQALFILMAITFTIGAMTVKVENLEEVARESGVSLEPASLWVILLNCLPEIGLLILLVMNDSPYCAVAYGCYLFFMIKAALEVGGKIEK